MCGATGNDGHVVFIGEFLDLSGGQWEKRAQAKILAGIKNVQKVVRDLGAVLGCGLGGADVHMPVDLPAVGVDDLPGKRLSQGHRQPGLTDSGGAYDEDNWCGVLVHPKLNARWNQRMTCEPHPYNTSKRPLPYPLARAVNRAISKNWSA